jgi:hypothetical protein
MSQAATLMQALKIVLTVVTVPFDVVLVDSIQP